MKYVINYDDHKNDTLESFIKTIESFEGKKLSDLKVIDFSYDDEGNHIYPGNGVYLFREGKQAKYIGKCNPTSFTERIANHFDLRPHAWMNSLLKNICKKEWQCEVNDENLTEASLHAFENYNIVLIKFTIDFHEIASLEKVLIWSMESLNSPKYKRIIDKANSLKSYY